MNAIEREQFDLLKMTLALRSDLFAALTDSDLTFQPPGDALTLGAVLKVMGEVQHAYTESFRTFRLTFAYQHADDRVAHSIDALRAWFEQLDAALMAALRALSDEDISTKQIDRGGWSMPPMIQFHTFREALLIEYGKIDVYLRMLAKTRGEQWQAWIG
ncbi:MAG TPA: DinB family protein [Aggregatilineales bacterium]|jgi:hypothetical protein|nr:DinB family protein [Aggregatilineales bacterium]